MPRTIEPGEGLDSEEEEPSTTSSDNEKLWLSEHAKSDNGESTLPWLSGGGRSSSR
jgi:hypothetical protein